MSTISASGTPFTNFATALNAKDAGDDDMRYNRLMQEYTRQKAQNTVLKRAVLEEQQKSRLFSEQNQQKDMEIRKLEGQLDIGMFHNQRLTKRVESMQHELKTGNATTGSWLFGSTLLKKELEKARLNIEVMSQDLRSKIEDNANLHRTLSGIEEEHEKKLAMLSECNRLLEGTTQDLKEELAKSLVANEDQLLSLRRHNSELESVKKKLSAELENLQAEFAALRVCHASELQALQDQKTAELMASRDKATQSLQSQLDAASKELDELRTHYAVAEAQLASSTEKTKTLEAQMDSLKSTLAQERLRFTELEMKIRDLDSFKSQQRTQSDAVTKSAEIQTDKTEPMYSPNETVTEGGDIVLRISDYWKAGNDELQRESLLKKYYEEKISRYFKREQIRD